MRSGLAFSGSGCTRRAPFTGDDPATGTRAGDSLNAMLFARLLAEEYAKLLRARDRDVHDDSKADHTAHRAGDRRGLCYK